jgi:hypothetical protein
MSKLEETFQKISAYPNGEAVAKRLTQLWDMAIVDEDSTIPERVMQVIESYEERLLQRSQIDMVSEKTVLPNFRQALKECTDEEWWDFKKAHEIKPLEKPDRERLFADASGLVKNTGFEEWVIGKNIASTNKEKGS